jgi:hypothetical protein
MMKAAAFGRIVLDHVRGGSIRGHYWATRAAVERIARLTRAERRPFQQEVIRSQRRFLSGNVEPIVGETRARARAAVEWLCRAQDATPDDGVSVGYFPDAPDGPWRPSYPETTGYIIPSLLNYAERYADSGSRERAKRMAIWETMVQMQSGAVQAGPVCSPERQTPAVFNTGMALQGYVATLAAEPDERVLVGARLAADFLVADVGPDGHLRTHGRFVTGGRIKTYNCLCAWPLYRLGEILNEERYRDAAVRTVEASLREQRSNGWFAHNCLSRPEAPLVHTIGYTLQGILEVGLLARRKDFVDAVVRGVRPLLDRVSPTGFLHGRFYADWEPACFSSCLTGNAQIAVVCYRLFEAIGDERALTTGHRLTNFLKGLQALESGDPGVDGAIAGSFPILGSYMTGGYPNWATKYFLDALMLQDQLPGR